VDVPRDKWTEGAWNNKLPQFHPLASWFGVDTPNPTSDELQQLYRHVSNTVFAESIPEVLKATGMTPKDLQRQLRFVCHKLGIYNAIPPRSLKEGRCDPSSLDGSVAFVLGGTVSWMRLRLDGTLQVQHAGAKFERIVMLGSTRVCNASADKRHPYIRKGFSEGREPTEQEVLHQWVYSSGQVDKQFVFPDLPDCAKPLSLKEQLLHLVSSGQYEELVGDRKVFVAVNGGNALYIPLHMYQVLGLDDIWFSQHASNLVHPVPDYWWPYDQDLMTTPSGIIRLWIELKAAGCIK
jgi:hypothetical protein